MMRLLFLLALVASLRAQSDAESTNWRSGISLHFIGTRGVNWSEEYLYYDKPTQDSKVVYILADTLIEMDHNNRNIGPATNSSSNPPDEYRTYGTTGLNGHIGVIRYKVDRDMLITQDTQWRGASAHPKYTNSFSFNDLTFPGEVPVVGTVGPSGSPFSKANYYRGIMDDYGDEWHSITVADDDSSAPNSSKEYQSSDGKIWHFVVNPKTPCLTWRTNSSTAQFYTTPARTYYVPKVHAQTTFISGDNTVEINSLDGSGIAYQINGGGWTTNIDGTILTSTVFSPGTNSFEYRQLSNPNIKTRTVVKEPTHPSLNEPHGFVFYGSATNLVTVSNRLTRAPYDTLWNLYKKADETKVGIDQHDLSWRKGRRDYHYSLMTPRSAPNAMLAQMLGINYKHSSITNNKAHSRYALEMVINGAWNLDPIGWEIPWSGSAIPARELIYRGYYDIKQTTDALFSYDYLCSKFRSDQATNGMTPIDDIYIRDLFAKQVLASLQLQGTWSAFIPNRDTSGMWDKANYIGSMASMIMMPTYSTAYYGTSGWDGNTNVEPWTPYPNYPLTWKQALWDTGTTTRVFPDHVLNSFIEDLFCSGPTNNWAVRLPYFDHQLMGKILQLYVNLKVMNEEEYGEGLHGAIVLALKGKLISCNPNPNDIPTIRQYSLNLLNNLHPEFVTLGQGPATIFARDYTKTFNKELNNPEALTFYDDTAGGSTAPPPLHSISSLPIRRR